MPSGPWTLGGHRHGRDAQGWKSTPFDNLNGVRMTAIPFATLFQLVTAANARLVIAEDDTDQLFLAGSGGSNSCADRHD